jgi:hypothetical protein
MLVLDWNDGKFWIVNTTTKEKVSIPSCTRALLEQNVKADRPYPQGEDLRNVVTGAIRKQIVTLQRKLDAIENI